uniref:Uncharacterized protein n=1 Tax=Pithovirus LCPAC404 TaxID=2506597 RepID=A0A481ZCQ4_9VIRU|nr:MAG: hypothetical protein LCPAC404_01600 [Pithovirus LCPAC404]
MPAKEVDIGFPSELKQKEDFSKSQQKNTQRRLLEKLTKKTQRE